MSTHINAPRGALAESVLLPGDPLRAKFIAENFLQDAVCHSSVRNMLGFTGLYKGTKVSVQGTGMGMPSIGIYTWELINEFDAKNLIRIGTAGAFTRELKLGDVVMALAASTDSNFAHSYELNGVYAPTANWELAKTANAAAETLGITLKAGNVVTCDVFYEQNPDWWKKWAALGVLCVEMETAALYMNAAAHGVRALALLTMSDHFVTNERATIEEREKTYIGMIKIGLETAVK